MAESGGGGGASSKVVARPSRSLSLDGKESSYIRADKIDLKSLDIQLEKQYTKSYKALAGSGAPQSQSRSESQSQREEWEIDPAKLDIRYVIAHGTYGTVYRGTYDAHDVAVKILDWGEDGYATEAETANLRSSFKQEVAVWHKLDHPNVTKACSLFSF